MSIECDDWQEKMSLWLDGELGPEQYRELENHVASCPACGALFNIMRQVDSLLSAAPMALPSPNFKAGFQSKLAASRRSHTWAGFLILALATISAFGTIGLLVVFSGLVMWQGTSLADLLGSTIGILLVCGQAVGLMIDIILVVFRSMEHVLRHPLFLTSAFGTVALALFYARFVRHLVGAPRSAPVEIRGS
jgi:predicted anti-sigma-YlaC factor YlaD